MVTAFKYECIYMFYFVHFPFFIWCMRTTYDRNYDVGYQLESTNIIILAKIQY